MKKYLIITFICWLFTLASYLGAMLIIDPYQIFHKPWLRDEYFVRDMRIQASGIINNSDFDAAIIGTSMAANFSPGEASLVFGHHFVNLSLDGSFMVERSIVLDFLFRKKKVSAIIYSLDGFEKETLHNTPIEQFSYLYDDHPVNDIQTYTTLKNSNFLLCRNILISSDSACRNTTDLEHITEWASNEKYARRFGGLNKWLAAKNSEQVKDALQEISEAIQSINSKVKIGIDRNKINLKTFARKRLMNEHLLRYISEHPSVKFYLFFPPYSRLKYAIMKQGAPDAFYIYLETIKWIVHECETRKNVEVYGFETEAFLDDIANYKDTGHYHPRINSEILGWMKNRQHRLTASNVDEYLETISHLAEMYRLNVIGDKIGSYLKKDSDAHLHP